MSNTIELEGELKLRFSTPGVRPPSIMYVGMFAGESKPKPFQRKRPNLSKLPQGKLPLLHDMRTQALQLHKGSYRPCAPGVSRRLELAVQHIHEGYNTFGIIRIRGVSNISNQWRPESVLQLKDDMISFRPSGLHGGNSVDINYESITDYRVEDNEHVRPNDSGIEFSLTGGGLLFFVFPFVRDVKHTLEFFWNRYQFQNDGSPKLGSTHGRPLVTITTLSGEVAAPECPQGHCEVVDQDGVVVRPGSKMVPRARQMSIGGLTGSKAKEIQYVPSENRLVKQHWAKVVLHQGWLLKKGGIGIGSAKNWIKRYFVLYKTSQGHFLVYYADFTECPLFSTDRAYRNVVDLAKTTFIRPGSIRSADSDTPPNSFDIVTTEREWTLCAETQDNAQKWLILLTRAVDEDVAILPDEELLFKVKPKVDPTGALPATDYTTSLRVSAHGISVCLPDANQKALTNNIDKEIYFWVYTDFYKWSLLSQNGKLALLINVFADATFSRRNEFIFRNKEAVRLATSIEYFIEKFMCVMHIRLEEKEGIFDEVPAQVTDAGAGADDVTAVAVAVNSNAHGIHYVPDEEVRRIDEVDLLDLDMGSMSVSTQQQPQSNHVNNSSNSKTVSSDPFGSNPFGDDNDDDINVYHPTSNNASIASTSHSTNLIDDDLLGSAMTSTPAPGTQTRPAAAAATGSDDPFGADFFGDTLVAATPSTNITTTVTAPPLTSAQTATHTQWFRNILSKQSGSFYDDGSLQIAITVEVRGSQGRVTFFFRNQSPGALSNFQLSIDDSGGLTRYELGPGPSTIDALSNSNYLQQQLMVECMKPVAAIPTVTISYIDALAGQRNNTLPLPLVVASFNDPLVLTGLDFTTRWESLTAPGLQAQEIFHPSHPVVPSEITAGLGTVCKLHFIISYRNIVIIYIHI